MFVAFAGEARRNLSGPLLVVVGRISESGWKTGWSTSGLTAEYSSQPLVTIDVEASFLLDASGTRTPRPVENPYVIATAHWVNVLASGERVAIACLPFSGDPIAHVKA